MTIINNFKDIKEAMERNQQRDEFYAKEQGLGSKPMPLFRPAGAQAANPIPIRCTVCKDNGYIFNPQLSRWRECAACGNPNNKPNPLF